MWFRKKPKEDKAGSNVPDVAPAEVVRTPAGLGRVPGLRLFLVLIVLCGLVVGGAVGMKRLDAGVQKGNFGPVVQYVGAVLEDPPPWMPEQLGHDIARSILPEGANYNDPGLPARVQAKVAANPWIRKVLRISRRMSGRDPRIGLVTLSAQYRQPVAAVKTDQGLFYVDLEGFRLPEGQVPRYVAYVRQGQGKPATQVCYLHRNDAPNLDTIHYVEIQGVSTPPPPVGHKWDAEDLAEGLKLLDLMYTRPYVGQVASVDVRNFGGRINRHDAPFLRMTAQIKQGPTTDIRFGRFPGVDAPAEIPPDRKLQYLDRYVKDHKGILAGQNRYLDLRYDYLHVSDD